MNIFDHILDTVSGHHRSIAASKPFHHSMYRQSPLLVPPPGAQPFDNQQSIPMPAAPSGDVAIVTINVPPGWDGVIKRVSANVSGPGFVQGSGDLIWRILRSGQAVRGYDNIQTEIGSVEIPRVTNGILICENDVVQLMINNANYMAGGAFALGSLAGYLWPKG